MRASSGKQPGDPVRAVKAIVEAVASGKLPHHLLLGNDAFEGAMAKVDELRRDFMAGEGVDMTRKMHAVQFEQFG
ncbi:hypothetical protein [Undibacterium sp. GrIS 1.8]|uniref:hypothetical protein n=1 Tax=Undibacterium sp. GrIS 1.8 TaxID=3143934 RepID=UPI003396BEB2